MDLATFLSLQVEGLGDSSGQRLSRWLLDGEQVTWFGVFDQALVCVDGKFMVETKYFCLAEHDFSFFLLLKFTKLQDSAKALYLDFFVRNCRSTSIDLWREGAVLLLSELSVSPLLSNLGHPGLLLSFKIL